MPTRQQSWERYLRGLRRAGNFPGVWWLREYLSATKAPPLPSEAPDTSFFDRLMKEYPGQPVSGTVLKGKQLMSVERVG